MNFNPLAVLDALASLRTAKVKDAQIDLLRTQFALAEQKISVLAEENARLKAEIGRLKVLVPDEQFFDAGVCLFKVVDGVVAQTPLCKRCKMPIVQNPNNRREFHCTQCRALFPIHSIQAARRRAVAAYE